jgi:hypothetical protein
MNEEVRAGLEQVRYGAWPKVAYAELDFVAGYLFRNERLRHELWGGLGLVIVDAARKAYDGGPPLQRQYFETHHLVRHVRNDLVEGGVDDPREVPSAVTRLRAMHAEEVARCEERVRELEHALHTAHGARVALERSISWKATKPLRSVKQRLQRALR